MTGQVITLGLGTPSSVALFVTVGLSVGPAVTEQPPTGGWTPALDRWLQPTATVVVEAQALVRHPASRLTARAHIRPAPIASPAPPLQTAATVTATVTRRLHGRVAIDALARARQDDDDIAVLLLAIAHR